MSSEQAPVFGELLRQWRERALLTQEELAESAGVDARTLRRWESGRSGRPRSDSVRRISDTLGLSPNEVEMLSEARRRDPGHSTAPGAQGLGEPRELPSVAPGFVGRRDELEQIVAHARHGRSITAIVGPAGVGKTAFAVCAAHHLAPQFPDGQIFLDLHGFSRGVEPLRADHAVDRLLRSLGAMTPPPSAGLEEAAARFRSLVAGRRMLFLYDDVRSWEQLEHLLPGGGGCAVITTSRSDLVDLPRTATITLGVLSPSAAQELFVRTAEDERLRHSRALLAEIVERCGRLPSAVRAVAARVRARPWWSLSDLAAWLRATTAVLGSDLTGVHPVLDFSAVSFRQESGAGSDHPAGGPWSDARR